MAAKTKDELILEAEELGIEVDPEDTKADIEDKLAAYDTQGELSAETQDVEAETEAAGDVVDDGIEDTALGPPQEGQWVDLTAGDKTGTHAHYVQTLEADDDGNPVTILVRTRDADNELLTVDYADVVGTPYSGGR